MENRMLTPDQALQLVLERSRPLAPRGVPLAEAAGRRLAETVRADRDYPPFNRAMMDGYAFCPTEAEACESFQIVGQLAAGDESVTQILPGQCVEIMTGAACPLGTRAVVPFEHAIRDGSTLRLAQPWKPHQHIVLRGSESAAHSVLQQPGDLVTPLCTAVLASVGKSTVQVVPAPRIALITTGGELVSDTAQPGAAQIRDSNGPMLAALCTAAGVAPAIVSHVADDRDAILGALRAYTDCDLIVLTGGVSAGKYDLVPAAIRDAGGELVFHKVSQKPGKPLLFALRGDQCVFGLPGNPLAAHFCFHRYVATAIRRLTAHPQPLLARQSGTLTATVQANDSRAWFVLGRAERGPTCSEDIG